MEIGCHHHKKGGVDKAVRELSGQLLSPSLVSGQCHFPFPWTRMPFKLHSPVSTQ